MPELYDKNHQPIKPNEMYKGDMFFWAYFTQENDGGLRVHILDHDSSREFILGGSSFDTTVLRRVKCVDCSKKLDSEVCQQAAIQIATMEGSSESWFERARKDLGLVQVVCQT